MDGRWMDGQTKLVKLMRLLTIFVRGFKMENKHKITFFHYLLQILCCFFSLCIIQDSRIRVEHPT